jgi:hypothetical protein
VLVSAVDSSSVDLSTDSVSGGTTASHSPVTEQDGHDEDNGDDNPKEQVATRFRKHGLMRK